MQFKVPQNVQREDTIIGPVTLRQMAILGIGGGIAYTLYISLSKIYYAYVWGPIVGLIALLTVAFAFLKIHNLPFHRFLMNTIEFNLLAKKRIWIQGADSPKGSNLEKKTAKTAPVELEKQKKSIQEISKLLTNKK